MQSLEEELIREASKIEEKIVSIRRRIHENPELSYREFETSRLVEMELRNIGLEVKAGIAGTGVMGMLRGGKGKVVLLRADMDALPVKEQTDLPFKSKKEGVMHACGHDTHVAMLLGAAMILAKHKEKVKGTVKFVFQPAEEDGGRGGAKPMIEEGVMEDPKVDYAFALHITNEFESGTFATRKGAIMAIPDSFKIVVKGRGGHGSAPHETVDPIFISAQIINSLQGITSRIVNQTKPFVLSVCSIHAGSKDNIIPDEAVMEGTIRNLDYETRKIALESFKRIVSSICEAYNAKCEVIFKEDPYPITYNSPDVTGEVMEILSRLPNVKVIETEPIMGAEDFSRFLERAPGTFLFLGSRNEKKGCIYPNHSSRFTVDEDVLKYGAAALALLAIYFTGK
jgi:carboxypeptidase Ss1